MAFSHIRIEWVCHFGMCGFGVFCGFGVCGRHFDILLRPEFVSVENDIHIDTYRPFITEKAVIFGARFLKVLLEAERRESDCDTESQSSPKFTKTQFLLSTPAEREEVRASDASNAGEHKSGSGQVGVESYVRDRRVRAPGR